MTYHNTTDSLGAELLDYRTKAKAQDEIILEYFYRNGPWTQQGLAASEVLSRMVANRLMKPSTPITSVRRAMTNLMNDGKLEKTTTQIKGPHGRPEYRYRVPKRDPEQLSLVP